MIEIRGNFDKSNNSNLDVIYSVRLYFISTSSDCLKKLEKK